MIELNSENGYRYQLSRVYLPIYGWVHSEDPDEKAFDWVTSFEFLLEELIANSASEVVLFKKDKELMKTFSSLGFPSQLLKRIKYVDKEKVWQEAKSITSPLFEEFSLKEVSHDGVTSCQGNDEQITHAVLSVDQSLRFLLLGLRYKCQVDIRINEVKDSLLTIRHRTKYSETRANMSILQGVFRCYDGSTLNTLGVSDARKDDKMMEQFLCFLQDEEFRELSNANFCLGFPHLLKKAMNRVNQAARKISSDEKFKGLFSLSSKILTVAYQVPKIDVPRILNLFWELPYLPPIVDLRPIYNKAETRWRSWKAQVYPLG